MTDPAGESGISPIIAEILMVTFILGAAFLVYVILFQVPDIEKVPMVVAGITKNGTLVTILHRSGDPLDKSDFYLTVNGNRMPDTSIGLTGGSYPWSPGECLVINYNATDPVREVKLISGGSSQVVLASAIFAVPSTTPVPVCDDHTKPRSFAAGFWSLADGLGTTAYDGSCVVTDNGTVINGIWKTCANQSVLGFNGVSSLVTIPNTGAISPSANQITYEAWAYPVEQKTANVVQMRDWDGDNIYQDKWVGWSGGVTLANNIKYTINWAPAEGGNRQPNLNTWYHIVLTYDGSYLRLFVNGVEEKNLALTGALKTQTAPLVIGSTAPPGKFFNGNLANVAVYSQALTSTEIAGQYSANSPGVCPA